MRKFFNEASHWAMTPPNSRSAPQKKSPSKFPKKSKLKRNIHGLAYI